MSFRNKIVRDYLKKDAANDADGDDEIEQPINTSLKKTEEAGIRVVHEVKCKLYVKTPITIVGMVLMDKAGRRILLFVSASGTFLGCFLTGTGFYFKMGRSLSIATIVSPK